MDEAAQATGVGVDEFFDAYHPWAVWAEGRDAKPDTYANEQEAKDRARHLARMQPGRRVFLLSLRVEGAVEYKAEYVGSGRLA